MNRFSHSMRLMAVVALLLILPALLSATNVQCEPPYCPHDCPNGWDCTMEWLTEDWNNFVFAASLWALGYTVVVCCSY